MPNVMHITMPVMHSAMRIMHIIPSATPITMPIMNITIRNMHNMHNTKCSMAILLCIEIVMIGVIILIVILHSFIII